MFRTVEARTADDAWLNIAGIFQRSEGTEIHSSRLGQVHEILHVAITIKEPRQRWVVSREPAVNPAFAIAEAVWMLTGRNDARFLNYFNRALPKFAGHGSCYHGAYGFRLRRHFGDPQNGRLDQLERVYHALRNVPDSRQAIMQIWDCRVDLPDLDGSPADEDIPCNVLAMLKVRDGALHWTQVMRSNDLFLGLPYNIVQFTMLQEVLAGWLGVRVGPYNVVIDSLHVYVDRWTTVAASAPQRSVDNPDAICLDRDESEAAFGELTRLAEAIADESTSGRELKGWVQSTSLPPAYRNMLAVLCAEGVRRRANLDTAREIVELCGNPVYRHLCSRWFHRVADGTRRSATKQPCSP